MVKNMSSKITAKKIKKHFKIQTQITLQISREDDCFVAYCPELELSSHGESPAEARKNFSEVLEIFLDDILERGTFEKVLQECGWIEIKKNSTLPQWVPPAVISRESYPLNFSV